MKIGICGHFMFNDNNCNGQAIKTLNYYTELVKHYGSENISIIDTNNFKQKLIINIFNCISMAFKSDVIIIMPTKSLLKPLCTLFNIIKPIKKIKIIYVVVGGWLTEAVEKDTALFNQLKEIDNILVETYKLKKCLEKIGLCNVLYSPNFSTRQPIQKENAVTLPDCPPYNFCTFSRVTKTKGIIEAINAISLLINNGVDCTLDIFGQIDENFKSEFSDILNKTNGMVRYKGILNGNEIIPTLSQYYGMLFPTYYPGECFPGAVVEAMMAGVPVIASNWRYNNEVILNNKTGFIYELNDTQSFIEKIQTLINDKSNTKRMRNNSWDESKKYSPDNVMRILYDIIEK